MSLQGPEEDQFNLRSDMGSKDFILAAKFHTKQVINVEAVARNFSLLWRTRNGFKIKDQGNQIVLFIFENKLNCEKNFSAQPWSFDKFLVVFQRYYNNTHVRDLDFERVPFEVQVYDISISFMNKTVAEGLCSGIGEVCSSNFSVMEGGDHVRVKSHFRRYKTSFSGTENLSGWWKHRLGFFQVLKVAEPLFLVW